MSTNALRIGRSGTVTIYSAPMNDPEHDQLAADLGHQLKTPISVLQNVARNLRRSLEVFVQDVAALSSATEIGDAAHGDALRALAALLLEQPVIETGLPAAGRIEHVMWRLGDHGVDGDLGQAASRLIRGGMDGHIDILAPFLKADPQRALSLLDAVARIRNSLMSIESSAGRIRGLSTALSVLSGAPVDGTVDPAESLRRIVAQFEPALPQGMQILLEGRQLVPVRGRDEVLMEVWSNLLANAVEALGGKGTILIETEVRRESEPAMVLVRIIDDGPGLSVEDLDRIFEPFFTTRGHAGGSGLGLALAERMVTAIDGTIEVSSEPGSTCFTVTLRALEETEAIAAAGGAGG